MLQAIERFPPVFLEYGVSERPCGMYMGFYEEVFEPPSPYDFTSHLERFTFPGEPVPLLYDANSRSCRRLLRLPGVAGLVPVQAVFSGEPWSPRIVVRAWVPSASEAQRVFDAVLSLLRARLDYREFLERVERWPRLLRLAMKYPGLRPGRSLSIYEALVDTVVKQRISLRVALRIEARLVRSYADYARVGGLAFYSYPDPGRLAQAALGELRGLGLTRLKARALQEVARAEVEGRLPSLRDVERDPWGVAEELTGLYGVGRWTAELAVAMTHPLFPLGPSSDLAVRRGLARVLGGVEDVGEVLRGLGDYAGLVMYLAAYEYEAGRRTQH